MVAETGSLTLAARRLGVVPSVITKRINRLEDQMQVRLLQRSTRRITLTPEGEIRLPRLRAAVSQLDDIFRDAAASSAEVEGHLRIKSPTTIAILSLGEVLTRFPGAEIVDVRETAPEALPSAEQEILGEGDAARVGEVEDDDA